MSAPGNSLPTPSAYQQALEDVARCIQSGCRKPALDGKDRCRKHYKAARRADQQYKKRRRALARRKKLCTRCTTRRRVPGLKWCATCCARTKRLGSLGGDKHVYIARPRPDGFNARVEVDGYARDRYHGQGKRGRQPTEQLDDQDLRDARKHWERAVAALEYHSSDASKELPTVQRREIRDAADAEFNRAIGFIEDIWRRHRYSRPTVEKDED